MKYLFLLGVFFQVFLLKAQNWYISPKIERAFYMPSYLDGKPFNSSDSYVIEKKTIVKGNGLSPLNLGLMFGYRFNSKWSIETGMYTDESQAGYNLYLKSPRYYEDIESTLYESLKRPLNTGIASMRIPLTVQYSILSKERRKFHVSAVDISGGVSLLFKAKGESGKVLISYEDNFITELNPINVRADLLAFSKSFGMGVHMNIDFRLSWNKINLFDIGVGFMYSGTEFTNLPVFITENGLTSVYRFTGTPTKLTLQVSRDIHFKSKSQKINRKE